MSTSEMYPVNVSSVADFMQCRFRWWCRWIENRVPVNESPAFGAGRLLHLIFEESSKGLNIGDAADAHLALWRQTLVETENQAAKASLAKSIQVVQDLREALPMWEDKFPLGKTLEVEEPFEFELPDLAPGVLWRGRPDRVSVFQKASVWHVQHRGLASSVNFGTYIALAKRSYHEHLYAEYLARKYCAPFIRRSRLKYGGTLFDLVRKLKYRTNVGKSNESTKTREEMFFQHPMSVNLKSGLHQSVMASLVYHVREMQRVQQEWEQHEVIPAPNEKMNGGIGGNAMDPYYRVLVGEITLDDSEWFKDREDTYEVADASTE